EVVHLKGPFEAIEDHRMEGDTHHDSRTIGGNRQVSSAAMIRSLVWPDARARAAMNAAWRRDSTRASRQPQPATRQVRVVGLAVPGVDSPISITLLLVRRPTMSPSICCGAHSVRLDGPPSEPPRRAARKACSVPFDVARTASRNG